LGSPIKQARNRRGYRLPVVAAPVLFGVAATFALANTPASASVFSTAQSSVRHAAVPAAAHRSGATTARLLSATRSAAKHTSTRKVSYTVQSGDTLSAIAQHFYGDPDYWPVLFWANHSQIQYANDIAVGQVLSVPAKPGKIPNPPTVLAPTPPPAPVSAPAASTASTSAPTDDQTSSVPTQSEPVAAAPVQDSPVQDSPVQDSTVSTSGDGSFQACVIERESGGDSQVMNSSGHYGLYQFSASTWAEYGGNPADFGNASVAEQNQVFDNAMAAGGQSNWSAYDGC
jgi:LysM repeat protein